MGSAKEFFSKNANLGFILLSCVGLLTLMGLVILASASQTFKEGRPHLFYHQLLSLGVAMTSGFVLSLVNLERMRKLVWVIGAIGVLLLVCVLIPGLGIKVNGARRWLNMGFMNFQVSEFAKLAMIFCLAHYLSGNQRHIHKFVRGFLFPAGIICVCCLLILLEPDFGTAFLCGSVGFTLLFLVGVRLRYLLPSLLGGGLLFFIAVLLDPVRLKRLTSFLDVESHKMDSGYQLWQGMLAFAAGGTDGVGLGNGRQQMSFLPEAHNDFIFPIIGEELGLWFTVGVVGLFLVIFLIGVLLMNRAPNVYYFGLVAGAVLCIVYQAAINVGVVTGLLPTKGISLPFISYGGSNLVIMYMLVGLMINCLRTWSRTPVIRTREL